MLALAASNSCLQLSLGETIYTNKHTPIIMAIASTLSGFFTKTLEVKNNGSFKNLNPLSLLCLSWYSSNICWRVISFLSKMFFASINLPALIFSADIISDIVSILPLI
jgi:hypothetical protein